MNEYKFQLLTIIIAFIDTIFNSLLTHVYKHVIVHKYIIVHNKNKTDK